MGKGKRPFLEPLAMAICDNSCGSWPGFWSVRKLGHARVDHPNQTAHRGWALVGPLAVATPPAPTADAVRHFSACRESFPRLAFVGNTSLHICQAFESMDEGIHAGAAYQVFTAFPKDGF